MVIGIFGGTFDPIHRGHTSLANWISKTETVDKVCLMVSRLNPLKAGTNPASDNDRLAMAKLAVEDSGNVFVSDFELKRPLPSYSFETLCALQRLYPEHKFRFIIGADNWQVFNQWRNSEKIIENFDPIIYPRPGYNTPSETPKNVIVLPDAPTFDISSTDIRHKIAFGENIDNLVHPGVMQYISEHGLYR